MSTEHQRYSPDNQRAAIANYAARRGFEIVETYQDNGKSGLTLKGRAALKQLLSDVLSNKAKFQTILVLDVSRWGRFQDTDQAAHYEFMCREAGVSIHYCAEPFENEGGTVASIVKHMKRVMAAEYSRELSTRISRAQRHQAKLGFKQGGSPPYGTRRQVIDENGNPRMILKAGQRKALITDNVVYVHGPPRETALVTRIFEAFVQNKMRLGEIANWLNKMGRKRSHGAPWSSNTVRSILSNELYVGKYIFGKRLNNLGRRSPSHESDWVKVQMMPPIISVELFNAAQDRLAQVTRKYWSDDEITRGLARLLEEEGRLSYDLIEACTYLPRSVTVSRRCGNLSSAFRSVGFEMPSRIKTNSEGMPFSDDELLQNLRRIHTEYGHICRQVIDDDETSPSHRYYIRRFGGLVTAYQLAGFDFTVRSQLQVAIQRRMKADSFPPRRKPLTRNPDGTRFSDEQLVEKLKALIDAHGHLSKKLIEADLTIPTASFFAKRLGGLRRAYTLAGYVSTQREIMRAARERLGLPVLPVQRIRKASAVGRNPTTTADAK